MNEIPSNANNFAKILAPRNLLILALIAQTIFFVFFAYKTAGTWLRGDNFLYETPAWNLASGNGLTIARSEWEDPYLNELYYAAHPEKANSEFIPAVVFPVGYSYFLAAVYTIFGRSHPAAIVANLMLLFATVYLMYRTARRTFGDGIEFRLAMGLTAIFPLWAFWATVIMSDTLHLFLLTLFAFVFFVEKPSLRRVLFAGAILGTATVVRPYAILLPAALFVLGGLIFRCRTAFNFRNTVVLTALCGAFLGAFVLKNYADFGKPIVTSKGLGDGLWLSTQKDVFTDDMTEAEMYKRMGALGVSDFHRYHENKILLDDAIRQIRERPARDALVTLTSMPRLWISLGSDKIGGAGKIVLFVGFAALLVLMIAGAFIVRRSGNPMLVGSIVIAAYYTLVFAHLNNEGRYVLPARFFGFLLAAVAVGYFLRGGKSPAPFLRGAQGAIQ